MSHLPALKTKPNDSVPDATATQELCLYPQARLKAKACRWKVRI